MTKTDKLVSFTTAKAHGEYLKTVVIRKNGKERVLKYNSMMDENIWSHDEFYRDNNTDELFYLNHYTSTWDKWYWEADAIQCLIILQKAFKNKLKSQKKLTRDLLIIRFSELPADMIITYSKTFTNIRTIRSIVSNCVFHKYFDSKSTSYYAWKYGIGYNNN
tara:strand:- start:396 stop:881 length:486 start_codon:yes stop_codon:yes gene_type:complete